MLTGIPFDRLNIVRWTGLGTGIENSIDGRVTWWCLPVFTYTFAKYISNFNMQLETDQK